MKTRLKAADLGGGDGNDEIKGWLFCTMDLFGAVGICYILLKDNFNCFR
jgi:hypothetical protein